MKGKLFLALVFCAISFRATAFQTSYSLEEGDSYLVETNQELTQSLMMMGQSQDVKTNNVTTEILEVVSVEGDTYTIKVTTQSLRTEVTSIMGIQMLSSDDPSSDGGMYSSLVNIPYSFTMNAHGEILNISDLEGLQDVIAEILAGNPAAAQVTSLFSEETIAANLEQRFSIFSPKGDTEWTIEKELVSNTMPMDYSSTYKNDGNGSVSVDSDITIETSMVQMGMQVELDLSGTQEMKMTLDSKSGVPTESTSTLTMDGNSMAMGNLIPTSIFVEASTTMTKQ